MDTALLQIAMATLSCLSHTPLHISEVAVSLDQNEYSVMEHDSPVQVCASLSGATIDRNVIVMLTSSAVTASSAGMYNTRQ